MTGSESRGQRRTRQTRTAAPLSYAILTNPASGRTNAERKLAALKEPAEILKADIHGLETAKVSNLAQCARELSEKYDLIVVAGGDGTFSDVVNAIDLSRTPLAYLPMGSGNALKSALGYKGSLAEIAQRIRDGQIHELDLIGCDRGRRAVFASIGIEGVVLQIRNRLLARGSKGFPAYFRALFAAYLRFYEPVTAELILDGAVHRVSDLLSVLVAKHPFFGYGMKVVPKACFDDGQLHTLSVRRGLLRNLWGLMTSFASGNKTGRHRPCEMLTLKLRKPLLLQTDGNTAWASDRFTFRVLPRALKMKY